MLEFASGDEYVGQTVNFLSRLASHRRRWDDIVAIRFAPVAVEDLDAVERAMIKRRLGEGLFLRNLTLLAQPRGASPLDLTIDPEVQAAWLEAGPQDDDTAVDDERFALAQRRIRSRENAAKLAAHPQYEHVLESLASYVALVIPWPDTTEGRLWTLTAMPKTVRRADHRRLATLSIQNVEMLVLGETKDGGDWAGYTLFNTAVSETLPRSVRGLGRVTTSYRSAGPVHQYDLRGLDVLPELLAVNEVRRAARSLALGQLRKGRAAFARFHNDALTDDVFARIALNLEDTEDAEDTV